MTDTPGTTSGPLGLDPHLLSILACPDTHHSPLTVDEEAGENAVHDDASRLPGPRRHPGAAARRGAAPERWGEGGRTGSP